MADIYDVTQEIKADKDFSFLFTNLGELDPASLDQINIFNACDRFDLPRYNVISPYSIEYVVAYYKYSLFVRVLCKKFVEKLYGNKDRCSIVDKYGQYVLRGLNETYHSIIYDPKIKATILRFMDTEEEVVWDVDIRTLEIGDSNFLYKLPLMDQTISVELENEHPILVKLKDITPQIFQKIVDTQD